MLLKQRDIMIGLTSRLNERDETIISMQQELAEYDNRVKWVNQGNQRCQDRVKQLESLLRSKKIDVPQHGHQRSLSNISANEVPQQLYYDDEHNLFSANSRGKTEIDEGDESDSFYVNNFENSQLAIE